MAEWRRVERFVHGSWELCKMKDLRDGDLFRMFESDGTPITYMGSPDLFAVSEPSSHPTPEGNYQIEVL